MSFMIHDVLFLLDVSLRHLQVLNQFDNLLLGGPRLRGLSTKEQAVPVIDQESGAGFWALSFQFVQADRTLEKLRGFEVVEFVAGDDEGDFLFDFHGVAFFGLQGRYCPLGSVDKSTSSLYLR